MTMHTECVLRDTRLPKGFDFDYATADVGFALIPPKAGLLGGVAPRPPAAQITPDDILQVQAARKFLYLWGWAKYFDVFDDERAHITRFCWQVVVNGDPATFRPESNDPRERLVFSIIYHEDGNCADEECKR
jgi:hypothetical protein